MKPQVAPGIPSRTRKIILYWTDDPVRFRCEYSSGGNQRNGQKGAALVYHVHTQIFRYRLYFAGRNVTKIATDVARFPGGEEVEARDSPPPPD